MRILLRLLFAGLVLAACTAEQPPTGGASGTDPATTYALPGDEDALGKLPPEVGGFKVSRGATKGYVDDLSCKECHEQIFATYLQVGMGRSLFPPDPKTATEAFDQPYFHAASGRYYVMTVRGGKYYQKRYLLDRKGQEYAVHEVEVKWVIGSGNHVRSYLSQNEYGELKELPLSWYTDEGWAMSPGFDAPDHPRFQREISRQCMFCHNGYPELPLGADENHKPNVYPQTLPHGIGCQRCHGPGARHVEAALDEASDDETIRERIHNPKVGDELCMTCHLQPESMVGELMPSRFGANAFAHQPGQSIRDHLFFLDHDKEARGSRFEVNHHGYRMHQSKCYTMSEGRLRCTTCHDPHKKVEKANQADHYRRKCAQCHQLTDCEARGMKDPATARQSDCVACHMQKARPIDVVHVTVTDHRIGKPDSLDRTKPRAEWIPDQKPRQATVYYEEGPEQSDPRRRIYEIMAFPLTAPESELAELAREFQAKGPHTPEGFVRVGRALCVSEDARLALPILQDGARRFPQDGHVLWALGEAWLRAKEYPRAAMTLQKALEFEPDTPGILASLGESFYEARAYPRAEAALSKAYAIRPDHMQTLQVYSDTLLALGKTEAALRVLRQLFSHNPDDDFTARMIVRCLERAGEQDAMYEFMEQVSTHVRTLSFDLIHYYAFPPSPERKNVARALELAKEALAKDQNDGDAHAHHALALVAGGQDHTAALRRARSLGADAAMCTAIEVLHALRAGERGAAERLLRRFQKEVRTPSDEPWRDFLVRAIQPLQTGR